MLFWLVASNLLLSVQCFFFLEVLRVLWKAAGLSNDKQAFSGAGTTAALGDKKFSCLHMNHV